MTADIFFWYVFPLLVSAFGIVWLIYDSRKDKHRQHPGE